MLALITAALLAQPHAAHLTRGTATHFYAPLRYTGITPAAVASWAVSGVPAPTVAWWGDDPTGAAGKTTGSWSATGSPTTGIDTPFCPGGSFADLGNCNQAVRLAHTPDYYTGPNNSLGEMVDGQDWSVCAVFRPGQNSAEYYTLASKYVATPKGWTLQWRASSSLELYVYGNTTVITSYAGPALKGSWVVACFSVDRDGLITPYVNGVASTTKSAPAGTSQAAAATLIGTHPVAGYSFDGDVASLMIWDSTALSATQIKTLAVKWFGLLETRSGTNPTIAQTGPTYCFFDGLLEMLSDNWPRVGCEIPPGASGSGLPTTGGYLAQPSNTNVLKGSRLQNANWTESGSSVVTNCTQTSSPFRDGRPTCLLTDNDGSAVEYIYQDVDITELPTGGKVQLVAYARDSDDTVLDLQLVEGPDGVASCTGSTTDFAAKTINTTWTQYEWTHTVSDGDCTNLQVRVGPTDFATAASTTTVQVVMQLYRGMEWSPISYIETTSAAVSAGADELSYAVSGGFLDGSGNIKDGTKITYNETPVRSVASSKFSYEPVWQLSDGTASQRTYIYGTPANGYQYWGTAPGADSITLTGISPYTPGVALSCETRLNYTSDIFSARVGSSSGSSTTARTSPTGVNLLQIGYGSGSHLDAIISDFKVQR